ncbi:uncharacterized protein LOC108598157 [Drosophila busckii]|uniref:uncharacterized protein LOC108598157 n=1 Tax=Drosophila busckii TaxID=30019 RepID=UPI00083EE4B1|nr:uncharacterized protein LOC108598157 [Drosophila busckii]
MNSSNIIDVQLQKGREKQMDEMLQQIKENEAKAKQLQAAVRKLPHTPANCPVCRNTVVFPTNLLTHLLHKHVGAPFSMHAEIYEQQPLVVCFDPLCNVHGNNHCLASLLYGGVRDRPETRPGLSYLSRLNSALIRDNQRYNNYLPIMLLACRSTWYAQLGDKHLERELSRINGHKAGLNVIWLVAPKTTRKLYFQLTIYDRYHLNIRSVKGTVRNYTSSQNPSDFMPHEHNYLLLCDEELDELLQPSYSSASKEPRQGVTIELILFENPAASLRHFNGNELQTALQSAQAEMLGYSLSFSKLHD